MPKWSDEVEWSEKETLSYSREKDAEVAGDGEFPAIAVLRTAALEELPAEVNEPTFTAARVKEVLGSAHLFGPVRAFHWKKDWQGRALTLEVWYVKTATGRGEEPFMELSFKDETTRPVDDREKLGKIVRDVLQVPAPLKTELVYQRYKPFNS